jgi:hypothetical protein
MIDLFVTTERNPGQSFLRKTEPEGQIMNPHKIVSREAWYQARQELLAEEKEFTRPSLK